MSGTIYEYGHLMIPDDKKTAFLNDAKTIVKYGGLFSKSTVRLFEKELNLILFPKFEGTRAEISHSYFEENGRQQSGLILDKCKPYSCVLGKGQFNKAMYALFILAELYSDELYFTMNSLPEMVLPTIRWIRYILGRDDLHLMHRQNIWSIYEYLTENKKHEYDKQYDDVLNSFCGDTIDYNKFLCVYMAEHGVMQTLEELGGDNSSYDLSKGLSLFNLIEINRKSINKYKASSTLDEDSQIYHLLEILTYDDEAKEKLKEDKNEQGFIFFQLIQAPITVKLISEMYNRDFWELWNQVKGRTTVNNEKELQFEITTDNETLCTDDFFDIYSDDRLYWWGECDDIVITFAAKAWLKELSAQFNDILNNENDSTDITRWQKRLVDVIARFQNDTLFFEELFYEFFGSLHRAEYRAWVSLLEEQTDPKKYKRLVSVLANHNLRKNVFETEME